MHVHSLDLSCWDKAIPTFSSVLIPVEYIRYVPIGWRSVVWIIIMHSYRKVIFFFSKTVITTVSSLHVSDWFSLLFKFSWVLVFTKYILLIYYLYTKSCRLSYIYSLLLFLFEWTWCVISNCTRPQNKSIL